MVVAAKVTSGLWAYLEPHEFVSYLAEVKKSPREMLYLLEARILPPFGFVVHE